MASYVWRPRGPEALLKELVLAECGGSFVPIVSRKEPRRSSERWIVEVHGPAEYFRLGERIRKVLRELPAPLVPMVLGRHECAVKRIVFERGNKTLRGGIEHLRSVYPRARQRSLSRYKQFRD
jgi:hypothetical protein